MATFQIAVSVVGLCVMGLGGAVEQSGGRKPSEDRMPRRQLQLKNDRDAIDRAMEATQFAQLAGIQSSARLVSATDDNTPFLSKELIGRKVWRVEVDNVSLKLRSAVPGFKDHYLRKFVVILDAATGEVRKVVSKFHGNAPEMRPEPAPARAESQLRASQEIYHGWPEEPPQISFLEALDAVLSGGIGSPFEAKEIIGVYVLESKMGSEPRPVWAITLRGIPPLQGHGPGADTVPVWQRNHIRNVVDARTGKCLFATNVPQPDDSNSDGE